MAERAPYYRTVFVLAALYNLAFGAWAVLAPRAFFDLFDLVPPLYPSIWGCLGMVVGVYSLAYAYAALRLERAFPFIAIGLLGKILGPIGWALCVRSGEWPWRTFALVLFNDLVWWLPFALFLIDGTRAAKRVRDAAGTACAVLNGLAAISMPAVLGPGTELVPRVADRAAYITSHAFAWRAGWSIWIAAALSLVAFYAWWGAALTAPASGRGDAARTRRWCLAAFLIAVAGMIFDLGAEALFIGWLPDRIERIQPLASLLTGGAANGLYTVAGILLTLRTPGLRGPLLAWTWAVWAAGIALTLTTIAGHVAGIMVSTALLMILFCPWAWVMGRRLR